MRFQKRYELKGIFFKIDEIVALCSIVGKYSLNYNVILEAKKGPKITETYKNDTDINTIKSFFQTRLNVKDKIQKITIANSYTSREKIFISLNTEAYFFTNFFDESYYEIETESEDIYVLIESSIKSFLVNVRSNFRTIIHNSKLNGLILFTMAFSFIMSVWFSITKEGNENLILILKVINFIFTLIFYILRTICIFFPNIEIVTERSKIYLRRERTKRIIVIILGFFAIASLVLSLYALSV